MVVPSAAARSTCGAPAASWVSTLQPEAARYVWPDGTVTVAVTPVERCCWVTVAPETLVMTSVPVVRSSGPACAGGVTPG